MSKSALGATFTAHRPSASKMTARTVGTPTSVVMSKKDMSILYRLHSPRIFKITGLSVSDKSITGDVSLFSQKIINESLSIASQIALYAAISRLLPAAAPLVVIPRIIGSPSNVSYSKNTSWAGTKNCFSSIKEIARVQLNLVEWSK